MFKYISFVLIIALVYILTSVFVDVFSQRPISLCGYSISYVPTKSMEPIIPAKSYIVIRQTDDIEVGDIVVYQSKSGSTKGMYIIHRVIKETENGYIFQGDNNPMADEEIVTKDMIYGIYCFTVPLLGRINRSFMFLIIIIIFVLMFLVQLVNIVMKFKKDKTKLEDEECLNKLRKEIYFEELKKIEEEARKS